MESSRLNEYASSLYSAARNCNSIDELDQIWTAESARCLSEWGQRFHAEAASRRRLSKPEDLARDIEQFGVSAWSFLNCARLSKFQLINRNGRLVLQGYGYSRLVGVSAIFLLVIFAMFCLALIWTAPPELAAIALIFSLPLGRLIGCVGGRLWYRSILRIRIENLVNRSFEEKRPVLSVIQ